MINNLHTHNNVWERLQYSFVSNFDNFENFVEANRTLGTWLRDKVEGVNVQNWEMRITRRKWRMRWQGGDIEDGDGREIRESGKSRKRIFWHFDGNPDEGCARELATDDVCQRVLCSSLISRSSSRENEKSVNVLNEKINFPSAQVADFQLFRCHAKKTWLKIWLTKSNLKRF